MVEFLWFLACVVFAVVGHNLYILLQFNYLVQVCVSGFFFFFFRFDVEKIRSPLFFSSSSLIRRTVNMSRMSYLVNDAFTFQNYVNGVFDGILIAEVALDRLLHDGGQSALVNNYTSVSISC